MLGRFGATPIAAQTIAPNEEKQIDALIAKLVADSKASVFNEGDTFKDPGYDHTDRERILAVRDALFAKGIAAFPRLISHVDDRRYSYTDRPEKLHWKNKTVGDVCYEMIADHVEVYQPLIHIDPIELDVSWVPSEQDKLKKWWE